MSNRNRPGQTVRIGTELATAALGGAPQAEAEALARKLLEREAAYSPRREELRPGTVAMLAFRHSDR